MVNPNTDDTQFFEQSLSTLRRTLTYDSSSPEQWLKDARQLLSEHPDREEALQPLLRQFQNKHPAYEEAVSEILGGRMPQTDEEARKMAQLSEAYHNKDWQTLIEAYEWLKSREIRLSLQYQGYYETAQKKITQPDPPESPLPETPAVDEPPSSNESPSDSGGAARATPVTEADERVRQRIRSLLGQSESALRRDQLDEALQLVDEARGLWDTMEYPDNDLDKEIANYSDRVMRQRDERNRIREAQDALAEGNWQRAYEIYDTAYHTFGEDVRFGRLADQMRTALEEQSTLVSQVKDIDPMTEDVDAVIQLRQNLVRLPNTLSEPPLSFYPAPTEQQLMNLDEVDRALRKIARHWLNEGETALQEAYQSVNLEKAEEQLNAASRHLRLAQRAARDDNNLKVQVDASIRGVSDRRSELQTSRVRRRIIKIVAVVLLLSGAGTALFLYTDAEQQESIRLTDSARQTAAVVDSVATQTQSVLDALDEQRIQAATGTERALELQYSNITETASARALATRNAEATAQYIRENPPTATPVFLCRGASTASPNLAVRAAPSSSSNAISALLPGDEVEVYAIEGSWYEIVHRNASGAIDVRGWVSSTFIDTFDSCRD